MEDYGNIYNIPEVVKQTNRFGIRRPDEECAYVLKDDEWTYMSSSEPEIALTYDQAVAIIEESHGKYELVWLCTRADNMFILDIDDVQDYSIVNPFLNRLNTYTEISRSGQGYHVIGQYSILPGRLNKQAGCRKAYPYGNLELYHMKQITLTGNIYNGLSEVRMKNAELHEIAKLFPHILEDDKPVAPPARVKKRSNDEVLKLFRKYNHKTAPLLDMPIEQKNKDKQGYYVSKRESGQDDSSIDFKLLSCLYFYTADIGQAIEIFNNSKRWTPERAKKKGNGYLERTGQSVMRYNKGKFYGRK